MAGKKQVKKKCCGKFTKKGKHCGSCPLTGASKKCKADKKYCKECDVAENGKRDKQDKKRKEKDSKKKK